MSDPDFWTDVTANPSREWYWRILAANIDGSTTAFGVAVNVLITYDVIFKQW